MMNEENVYIEQIDYTEEILQINDNLSDILEINRANYTATLFEIGVVSAVFVCCLLYKVFKLFY